MSALWVGPLAVTAMAVAVAWWAQSSLEVERTRLRRVARRLVARSQAATEEHPPHR